ncbi:hypothetical protein GCK72_007302 [Caenorhabditis remanei]|uniref:C-type LECtin n=1 Tax=Caenorhabditis remanei TaxID=31234 RepID=A0A6A5HLT6_CAERE|nr:hypothetical protein GCK72_007302 [Caenorhabditis remanei]KAF1767343.1 hypothetical protein GCK72_007302 [Caenorhabditis remanei]
MISKSVSIFLLLALFSIKYSAGQSCPTGFQLVNQNKCLRVFAQKLKHLEAETDCSYLGGTLVTIKTAIDNRVIANIAANAGASSIWIGIFCFATGNTTTCYPDDNSGELTYNSFASGNPAVTGNGGCVYMQTSGKTSGQWLSAPCAVVGMPFVCEVPMTVADPTCSHNYNGYCYTGSTEMHLATINTTYDRAQSICQSKNSDLVSIHSKQELDFIRAIYRNSGIQQIFVGAQAFLPDTFDWSDGSNWNFDYTDPLATSKGNCLVMDLSDRPNNGMWSQTDCQNVNFFLCKRKIGDATVATTVATTIAVNPKFKRASRAAIRNELLDFSNCNSTLVLAPGTITSFGYPNTKPPITTCTWNIGTLGPYRVGVYFPDFSVYNAVYVYDEYGNIISSVTGNMRPYQVLGTSNVVTITHDSRFDAAYNYNGFSATILPY